MFWATILPGLSMLKQGFKIGIPTLITQHVFFFVVSSIAHSMSADLFAILITSVFGVGFTII